MEQQVKEEKALKRRRLLLVVPIFLLAFGGLFYLAISWGSAPKEDTAQPAGKSALNTALPEASLQPADKNKLEIYMQAEKDSAKRREDERNDPYSGHFQVFDPLPDDYIAPAPPKGQGRGFPATDPNEQKMNDRLEKLYAALSDKETSMEKPSAAASIQPKPPSGDIAQMEAILQSMQPRPDSTPADPEMLQINGVIDKLLDLQYPQRVQERMMAAGPLAAGRDAHPVSAYPVAYAGSAASSSGFYGLESAVQEDTIKNETILAVIHQTQTLQNGSTVKLRLLQDMYVGKKHIPAGNFLFGTCSINDERLTVQLFNAIYRNEILPIQLSVYDTDGLEGVHVPGAITRNAAKDGSGQFLQSVGAISTVDPSLAAQATAAGIQTATGLLSRKVKNIQVTVRAGHQVLLRNKELHH